MRIEPAAPDDLDAAVDGWIDLAADQRRHGSHLLAGENREPIRATLARHVVEGTLLVARDDGSVIGFVNFEIEGGAFEQDAVRGLIHNVYVDPSRRNEGVGSALVDAAEAALADAGADVVAIEALAGNDGARRLYEERGYEPHRIEYERPAESDTHSSEDG